MSETNDELTIKRAAFCKAYVVCYNGSEAARVAGYSAASAGQEAARLLKDAKVLAEIKRLEDEQEQSESFTRLGAIALCMRALSADASIFYDDNGNAVPLSEIPYEYRVLIKKVIKKITQSGETVTYELMDKDAALERLARLRNWQGADVSVNVNITDEDAERRIKELMEELEKGKTNE